MRFKLVLDIRNQTNRATPGAAPQKLELKTNFWGDFLWLNIVKNSNYKW